MKDKIPELTLKEACGDIKGSPQYPKRLGQKGILKAVRIGVKVRRYRKEDIEIYS